MDVGDVLGRDSLNIGSAETAVACIQVHEQVTKPDTF
jgi:hypothetical protein